MQTQDDSGADEAPAPEDFQQRHRERLAEVLAPSWRPARSTSRRRTR
ncbi:MAG: hypothetical protein R2716_08965 [Microthrixaceae bacterium]